jgi:hypothetical protein
MPAEEKATRNYSRARYPEIGDEVGFKGIGEQTRLIDLLNIYRADEMKQASFRYASVGRAELK